MNKLKLFLLIFAVQSMVLLLSPRFAEPKTKLSTQVTEKQVLTTDHTINKVIVMQSSDTIMFDATGTVTKISIEDNSKKYGIQNLYTYLTFKIEKVLPTDVASKLIGGELSLSRQTKTDIDPEISVGDKVTITVIGNNLSDPSSFRIYEIKKCR